MLWDLPACVCRHALYRARETGRLTAYRTVVPTVGDFVGTTLQNCGDPCAILINERTQ